MEVIFTCVVVLKEPIKYTTAMSLSINRDPVSRKESFGVWASDVASSGGSLEYFTYVSTKNNLHTTSIGPAVPKDFLSKQSSTGTTHQNLLTYSVVRGYVHFLQGFELSTSRLECNSGKNNGDYLRPLRLLF